MLFRAIIQGESGSGKTSLLASAANAGYRVLLADFDHCPEPLYAYTTSEGLNNIHVIPFDDGMTLDDDGLRRTAVGAKAFERFIYGGRVPGQGPKDEPRYGRPLLWGPDTILVLDTLTALGECCEARMAELNPTMPRYSNAYAAAQDQEKICALMVSLRFICHVIVLSHLRLISPKAESTFDRNETSLQKQIKRERADLQETGFYPTAVTEGIARNFTRHFPFALLTEEDHHAQTASKRVLRTKPVAGYKIKCPLDLPDKLPVETALATVLAKVVGQTS